MVFIYTMCKTDTHTNNGGAVSDFLEIDFLAVETSKSGDAIALRYSLDGIQYVHIVDGGYLDTGDKIVAHLDKFYGTRRIDHVVLTHPDQDHANGLRRVLEHCEVGMLWMNRPWIYADELIDRFATYNSVEALRRKLRDLYPGPAALEDLAIEKGIPISAPFQGQSIGAFTVLSPTKARYLDLVVESERTPEAVGDGIVVEAYDAVVKAFKKVANLVKAAWGAETFPTDGTSNENEMSVVQIAIFDQRRFLLTGDTGRDGLTEAADYLEALGHALPGVWAFQVPHHGGRHNVNTEVLDRWLGQRLDTPPSNTGWNAICSSAKEDEHHPRNSVIRAMIHRGAHFAATEGRDLRIATGIDRDGWTSVAATPYPDEQEE